MNRKLLEESAAGGSENDNIEVSLSYHKSNKIRSLTLPFSSLMRGHALAQSSALEWQHEVAV